MTQERSAKDVPCASMSRPPRHPLDPRRSPAIAISTTSASWVDVILPPAGALSHLSSTALRCPLTRSVRLQAAAASSMAKGGAIFGGSTRYPALGHLHRRDQPRGLQWSTRVVDAWNCRLSAVRWGYRGSATVVGNETGSRKRART